jgi:hypothetical protein
MKDLLECDGTIVTQIGKKIKGEDKNCVLLVGE